MKNLKDREKYINEGITAREKHWNLYNRAPGVPGWPADETVDDDDDFAPVKDEWKPLKREKKITLSEAKEIAYRVWAYLKKQSSGDSPEELVRKSFENWWDNQHLNENILPKPYKTTKCLECGEIVCDDINKKIGHLYNKHNCKPSVDDYKSKVMMQKYFK